jgi:hypothetical protein
MQTKTDTHKKIVLAVIALLVLVGGGYMLMGKGDAVTPDTQEEVGTIQKGDSVTGENPTKETPVAQRDNKAQGSFKDLLGKTSAQKCTVSQSSTISKSSGVFYSSGGKGRGEFESAILSGPGKGTVSKASIIIDGDTMYTWDDTTKQGIKLSLTGTDGNAQNDMVSQMNQAYDYDCVSWKADASMFVPPAGIVMTDMSEMMKSLPKMPVAGKLPVAPVTPTGMPSGIDMSAMCGSCDQAGDERDACRAALGCK